MNQADNIARRANDLSAARAALAAGAARARIGAVLAACRACGLTVNGALADDAARAFVLRGLRRELQTLRAALSDGSDEPRYTATGAALDAVGALWAVSQ